MTSEPVPAASRADAKNLRTATEAIVPRGGGATLAHVPVTTTPTQLLVLRHGQSEWNASGRWQGQADPPLDRAGQLQAVAASEVLGTFDAVWASDLQRASLTAQIIAELLGIGPVQIDARLRETDVGPWQGLTKLEVEQGWPGYLAERRRPDGFEHYPAAAARAIAALADIAAEHPGGQVLVVSHGGIIRAVRRELGAHDDHLPNLSGTWITVHDDRLVAGQLVTLLAEHLPASDVL
jgi:broad specificity phosphatase PhoE